MIVLHQELLYLESRLSEPRNEVNAAAACYTREAEAASLAAQAVLQGNRLLQSFTETAMTKEVAASKTAVTGFFDAVCSDNPEAAASSRYALSNQDVRNRDAAVDAC